MNICVFCGSSIGKNKVYAESARDLGILFAKKLITLVYGGGNVGLMGVLADAVLEHKGEVIGVIPDFLVKREVAHHHVTRLEIVDSMHQRKKRMADLSDAFIAIPGGWGTLDELAEILTWKQLGLIHQPIGLLNVHNFFDPLLRQMNIMAAEGFLRPEYLHFIHVDDSAENLVDLLSRQQG